MVQLVNDMIIKVNEFFVYDKNTGEIKEKVKAHSKCQETLPDLSNRWVLKHVNGVLDNNLYFPFETNICRSDCYVDPSKEINFKLKEGTEKDLEFFNKHGYTKPKGSSI